MCDQFKKCCLCNVHSLFVAGSTFILTLGVNPNNIDPVNIAILYLSYFPMKKSMFGVKISAIKKNIYVTYTCPKYLRYIHLFSPFVFANLIILGEHLLHTQSLDFMSLSRESVSFSFSRV